MDSGYWSVTFLILLWKLKKAEKPFAIDMIPQDLMRRSVDEV